jgi:hypothetical protein
MEARWNGAACRDRLGWEYSVLDPLLKDLEGKSRTEIAVWKQSGLIS